MSRHVISMSRMCRGLRTVAVPVTLIFALLAGNLVQAQDSLPSQPRLDGVAQPILAPLSSGTFRNPVPWSVRAPGFGDVNSDGRMHIVDVQLVASRWGLTPADPGWDPIMDLNGNKVIDVNDIAGIASVWKLDAPSSNHLSRPPQNHDQRNRPLTTSALAANAVVSWTSLCS